VPSGVVGILVRIGVRGGDLCGYGDPRVGRCDGWPLRSRPEAQIVSG